MANHEPEHLEEEPLDPVMEKVRRKMVRLQIVSAGIMFVSLMAVLVAVVYKASNTGEATKPVAASGFAVPADQPLSATATLPAGFVIQSVSSSGSQILFYGTLAGTRKAMIYDLSVGRIIADVTVAEH
ncbi:hypothetical protein [Rhizobium sp. SL86]|uniref:hypothetical protein n=1 Tax=Rhizobium sp. SL86 TaxID=2995148 RepID=UPI002276E44E|nr:hypothetical protein [Rhizobium sp. SL86]MCY1667963.1 hypothetical protein [Rhizobium sp. SL86]